MGNDEHGPAYPDDEEPGHWRHYDEAYDDPKPLSYPVARALVGIATLLAVILWVLWPRPAPAMDHGFDKAAPLTKYLESLQRPDMRPHGCCGEADAYPVDRYEMYQTEGDDPEVAEGWGEHHHFRGDFKVWLRNGAPIVYPDGKLRAEWNISVPIIVPSEKVNDLIDDLDNPSDTGWLFFVPRSSNTAGAIYCFERHPQGQ